MAGQPIPGKEELSSQAAATYQGAVRCDNCLSTIFFIFLLLSLADISINLIKVIMIQIFISEPTAAPSNRTLPCHHIAKSLIWKGECSFPFYGHPGLREIATSLSNPPCVKLASYSSPCQMPISE